jgi:hypothetical protein
MEFYSVKITELFQKHHRYTATHSKVTVDNY